MKLTINNTLLDGSVSEKEFVLKRFSINALGLLEVRNSSEYFEDYPNLMHSPLWLEFDPTSQSFAIKSSTGEIVLEGEFTNWINESTQ